MIDQKGDKNYYTRKVKNNKEASIRGATRTNRVLAVMYRVGLGKSRLDRYATGCPGVETSPMYRYVKERAKGGSWMARFKRQADLSNVQYRINCPICR